MKMIAYIFLGMILPTYVFAEVSKQETLAYINEKFKDEKVSHHRNTAKVTMENDMVTIHWTGRNVTFPINKVRFVSSNNIRYGFKQLTVFCNNDKNCIRVYHFATGKSDVFIDYGDEDTILFDMDNRIQMEDIIRVRKAFINLQENKKKELF